MNKLLFLLALWPISLAVNASDSTIVLNQFRDLDEAFIKAKSEDKKVMFYFHFDGCGACRKMEHTTFLDKSAYEFYNENFVTFEINSLKGIGIDIKKNYDVSVHPAFVFLDVDGEVLHKIVGVYEPSEFINQADKALSKTKNLTSMRASYMDGNLDKDFLFEYAYALRDASELDSIMVNEYLNELTYEELDSKRNIAYIYEFAIHNHTPTIEIESPAFQFLLNNEEKFNAHFEEDQVKSRIVWLLYYHLNTAIEKKDRQAYEDILTLARPYESGESYYFKEMDGKLTGILYNHFIFQSEMHWAELHESKEVYLSKVDDYIETMWDNDFQLNNHAWMTYENKEDRDLLIKAKKCSIRSIELKNDYSYNDTLAWILFKLGDKKEALEQAKTAILIGKKAEEDVSETVRLVELLEQ